MAAFLIFAAIWFLYGAVVAVKCAAAAMLLLFVACLLGIVRL